MGSPSQHSWWSTQWGSSSPAVTGCRCHRAAAQEARFSLRQRKNQTPRDLENSKSGLLRQEQRAERSLLRRAESPGLVDCQVDSGLVFCRALDFPSLDPCFFSLLPPLPSPITTSPWPGWSLTLRDNPSSQVGVLSVFIVQALCEKFISFPVTSSLTAYSLLTPHTVSPRYKLRALGAFVVYLYMCCWYLCGFFPPVFYVFIENNFSYIIF